MKDIKKYVLALLIAATVWGASAISSNQTKIAVHDSMFETIKESLSEIKILIREKRCGD